MKKSFTSLSELDSGVKELISDALMTDVSDVIKGMISKSARENVILETAGRSSGGVDDITQMESSVKERKTSIELKVKDIAKPSHSVFGQPFDDAKDASVGGTMFANWIENGQWIDLKQLLEYRRGVGWNPSSGEHWEDYYDADSARRHDGMTKKEWGFKPRREPRPFMQPVQDELESHPEIVIDAIKKTLA